MDSNWVQEILEKALRTWSERQQEIWDLITTPPETFRGGRIWRVIENIHGGLTATAYALLVLFFLIGVVRTTTNFHELRRPEQAARLFVRFAVAKGIVGHSMEWLLALYRIVQGIILKVAGSAGTPFSAGPVLPDVIVQKIREVSFIKSIPLWIVGLLGSLMVTALSILMILTVYSRFFSIFMHAAIAPVPLAAFAGEGTQRIAWQFVRSFLGACLQGVIIVLACVIYSAFASSPPAVSDPSASAVQMVWDYMLQLIFDLLVLVGAVKMSERIVKEMIGF